MLKIKSFRKEPFFYGNWRGMEPVLILLVIFLLCDEREKAVGGFGCYTIHQYSRFYDHDAARTTANADF